MNGAVVTAEGLSKSFVVRRERTPELKERLLHWLLGRRSGRQKLWALQDIDLRVGQGESVGVIGDNGSGKTTLLRCLAGILQPTRGTVDVRGRAAALLELGAGFHRDLTGRENVYLHASLHGVGRRECLAMMGSIVEFSELGEFIDVPVRSYSAGMYLRLGYSVAMQLEPDVLFIDEVIAVGDQSFQEKCFSRMQEHRDAGRTVVLVSHDLGAIERLCDRAILVDAGRLVAEGPAAQTIESYRRAGASAAQGGALLEGRLEPQG